MIEGDLLGQWVDYPKYDDLAFGANTRLAFFKSTSLETLRCHKHHTSSDISLDPK